MWNDFIFMLVVLGLMIGSYMVGSDWTQHKADKEIAALEERISVLENRKCKEDGDVLKRAIKKTWKLGKKGAEVAKDGAVSGFGHAKRGAEWTAKNAKDLAGSAASFLKDASGKVYRNKDEYLNSEVVNRIKSVTSIEELKAMVKEMEKVLDTDAVRKSVGVLNDSAKKCLDNPKCRAGLDLTVLGGAGSVVGSGLISVSGMTAAGMVGGGSGIGMAAGPVGAIAGATVGLATYGIIKAFSDKEKELKDKENAG